MFPLMHKILEMCEPWGIYAAVESEAEAKLLAKNTDEDWTGHSCQALYQVESKSTYEGLFDGSEDPHNGHKGEGGGFLSGVFGRLGLSQ
jgi:hypothetical protein